MVKESLLQDTGNIFPADLFYLLFPFLRVCRRKWPSAPLAINFLSNLTKTRVSVEDLVPLCGEHAKEYWAWYCIVMSNIDHLHTEDDADESQSAEAGKNESDLSASSGEWPLHGTCNHSPNGP